MIEIKKEFKELIPALTAEEFKQLEENILKDGIRDSIVLWNNFIIDGHNRYQIAMKHELQFNCIDMEFEEEHQVIDWMILNQLGKRNITSEQRSYLIGKRYESEKQKHGGQISKGIGKNFLPVSTAEKIGEEVGVSDRQVKINEQFAQGIDKMSDELKQQVLQGNLNINKSDIQLISKAEPTFIANTDKEIIEKAKEIKEQKAEAYKEKIKDYQKEYNVNNKEAIANYQKEYYEINKEIIANQQKEYYNDNRNKILEHKNIKNNCACGGTYTNTN